MPLKVRRAAALSMYCIRQDGDCSVCDSYIEHLEICGQDEDLGGTGHGDDSFSDADPGL